MKKLQPAYVVYDPPAKGFPYLSVILAPDGSVVASGFDTAEDATAFNKQMADSRYVGGVKALAEQLMKRPPSNDNSKPEDRLAEATVALYAVFCGLEAPAEMLERAVTVNDRLRQIPCRPDLLASIGPIIFGLKSKAE